MITKKSSYFVTLIICSILTVTGYINLDFFFSLCLVLLVLMNVCQQILVTKTCSSKFYYLFELSFYIRPKLWNIFNLPTVYGNINFAYYLKLCFKYFNFLSMFWIDYCWIFQIYCFFFWRFMILFFSRFLLFGDQFYIGFFMFSFPCNTISILFQTIILLLVYFIGNKIIH